MKRYIPPADADVDCVDDAGPMVELPLSSRKKKETRKPILLILILTTIIKVPTTQYCPQGISAWRLQLGIQHRVAHPKADGFYPSAKCFQISVQQELT